MGKGRKEKEPVREVGVMVSNFIKKLMSSEGKSYINIYIGMYGGERREMKKGKKRRGDERK